MVERRVHDRELLDTLEQLQKKQLDLNVWRIAWRHRDPLEPGRLGRWNPGSFTALYASCEKDGAIAEVYYHLSKAPVFSTADKLLYKLSVKTQATLCLDDISVLHKLGVEGTNRIDASFTRCQEIGAAAHLLEYDSLLVPNFRWDCLNLVIFPEILIPDDLAKAGKAVSVNWPAWREKNAASVEKHIRGQNR